MLQVNYGLLTDARGCPVAVSVHEGNVADSPTLMPEVQRLREDFGIEQLVMVGDRGMISNKAIEEMRETDGIGWITALKSVSIRALVEQGHLQLGLFDERNLLELSSPDYPGERLVACRNPELAKLRAHKREELLAATEANLEKIKARVDAGKLAGKDEIGLRVGKVVNQYKMAKHFELAIGDNTFTFARKTDAIAAEAALDGIYIIRTSVSAAQMDSADCVRNYKSLANVERAFRSLKTIDLKVRPIHHRTADRVRAHIFLCMLAYYVEWHMREAWRELMFADTDQQAKATRDPVAPAKRSKAALAKAARHTLDDGTPVHSFSTLMAELATIVRNTCRSPSGRPRGADLRGPHHAQREAAASARPHPADPVVDSSRNPDLTPSRCRARTNSLAAAASRRGALACRPLLARVGGDLGERDRALPGLVDRVEVLVDVGHAGPGFFLGQPAVAVLVGGGEALLHLGGHLPGPVGVLSRRAGSDRRQHQGEADPAGEREGGRHGESPCRCPAGSAVSSLSAGNVAARLLRLAPFVNNRAPAPTSPSRRIAAAECLHFRVRSRSRVASASRQQFRPE